MKLDLFRAELFSLFSLSFHACVTCVARFFGSSWAGWGGCSFRLYGRLLVWVVGAACGLTSFFFFLFEVILSLFFPSRFPFKLARVMDSLRPILSFFCPRYWRPHPFSCSPVSLGFSFFLGCLFSPVPGSRHSCFLTVSP